MIEHLSFSKMRSLLLLTLVSLLFSTTTQALPVLQGPALATSNLADPREVVTPVSQNYALPRPSSRNIQRLPNEERGQQSSFYDKMLLKQQRQRPDNQQLENLLTQLIEIENQYTDSLADCAHWFSLNAKYNQLIGNAINEHRESEIRKKEECDNLDLFFTETRSKLLNFNRLIQIDKRQLGYVGSLIGEYLDLNYAADVNEQFAKEFYQFKMSDQVRVSIEKLESFIEFMSKALRLSNKYSGRMNEPEEGEEFAESVSKNSLEQNDNKNDAKDELFELDTALKQLVDREETLTAEDFAHLTEFGEILNEILASGNVELNSGRFRYLNGTLDAVRAVILRKFRQFPQNKRTEDGVNILNN